MANLHAVIHSILEACCTGTPGSSQFATSTQVLSIISQAVAHLSIDLPLLHLHGRFAIVGDIHGDILSIVRIFTELGWPDTQSYLFLGDYVDRGKSSCEVLVLLYSLKILFPKSIFLLRGNHEFASMTQVYGFLTECSGKFVMRVYTDFVNSFQSLPIAAIVNGSVFCVHGGLAPELAEQIEDLRKITGSNFETETDILWSDPSVDVEGFVNSPRGRGFLFGIDAFQEFLDETEFTMMIRAHEDCSAGFEWPFGEDEQLLTVFSAVDYCQKGNSGAVAIVSDAGARIARFPLKTGGRPRILIPKFILEFITENIRPMTLPLEDKTSHLCIDVLGSELENLCL
jgi:diadenosine tetraphosphatase ApaH/serine/threonine PP2A family protein phosphatase